MRTLWLSLTLLLAVPAHGADKTVRLRLRHVPASEVASLLLPARERGLVPDGIAAWTVDERRNALTVTGSEDAIQEFRTVLRLLDAPAGHVRLGVRFVAIDSKDLTALGLPFDAAIGAADASIQTSGIAATSSRQQVAALEARPAISVSEMPVTSNHPLHLRWPSTQQSSGVLATVVPRINGDGSVTFRVSTRELGAVAETAAPSGFIVFRRIQAGTATVVLAPHARPRADGHLARGLAGPSGAPVAHKEKRCQLANQRTGAGNGRCACG